LLETINFKITELNDNERLRLKKRIFAAITIASKCGQAITYDEIAQLLPQVSIEINVKDFIQTEAGILEEISIQNQLITLKGYEHLFDERPHREQVSIQKFLAGIVFADSLLRSKSHIKLLAVCGSVAYGAATDKDDIDIFLVSQKNRMWITFAKSLLLARILNGKKMPDGRRPEFCLSYVQDEKNFIHEAVMHRGLLSARELLSVKVLAGSRFYHNVLINMEWLKQFLPSLYTSKVNSEAIAEIDEPYNNSLVLSISNTIIYILLGNYLRFKALIKNLSFKKKSKFKDLFEAKITKGSCVYNSERYKELEKMYAFI